MHAPVTDRTDTRRTLLLGLGVLILSAACGLSAVALARSLEQSGSTGISGLHPLLIILAVSLCAVPLASYITWPNRWNVIAHIQVGFCLSAYVIPLFLASNSYHRYAPADIRLYTLIVATGSCAFVTGVVVGGAIQRSAKLRLPGRHVFTLSDLGFAARVSRRVQALVLAGIIGMVLSFAALGFVPLFADDPLAAKFLRGPYESSSAVVSMLYRTSYYTLSALVPVVLMLAFLTRDSRYIVLSAGALAMLLGAGNRSQAFLGLLICVGLLAAQRTSWSVAYRLFVAIGYPLLGATFFFIMASLFGNASFLNEGSENITSIWDQVATGTPDVSDQLNFLQKFELWGELTNGLTFVGGLVPFRFEWNPSVWSLSIIVPNRDASEVISGGVRLGVAMSGYTAFGWIGVVLVPLVSGTVLGIVSTIARGIVGRGTLLQAAVAIMVYQTLGLQLVNYYQLLLYAIPGIAAVLLLTYRPSLSLTTRRRGAHTGHETASRDPRLARAAGLLATQNEPIGQNRGPGPATGRSV